MCSRNISRFLPAKFLALSMAVLPLLSNHAEAYFSTIDTGDLVAPGKYRASLEPQLILDKYQGFNIVGRFDAGVSQESSVRALLGFGKVDFQTGGFYKWVPYPDTEEQPAIGGEAGLIYARIDGRTEVSVRLHPLISKNLRTDYGLLTPYASIPFGVTTNRDETYIPIQIAGGAQWHPDGLGNISFIGEVGFNANRAFNYISLAAIYDFDDSAIHR